MFNTDNIQWEKLKRPSKTFSIFKPTPSKLEFIAKKLLNEYLYMPDEDRVPANIEKYMAYYLFYDLSNLHLFYEVGDFQGLVGFQSILPEYKCSVTLKLWDPKAWNSRFLRDSIALTDLIMDEFKLKRIESDSPDMRIVKMAKKAGFKKEGSRKYAFRWNNKFYSLHLLGKTRD